MSEKTLRQFWKAYGFELEITKFELDPTQKSYQLFQNFIKEKEQDPSKIFKTKGDKNFMAAEITDEEH